MADNGLSRLQFCRTKSPTLLEEILESQKQSVNQQRDVVMKEAGNVQG